MTRMNVKLAKNVVALIDKLAGKQSRNTFLEKALSEYRKLKEKITKLELEIEKLRSEKPPEAEPLFSRSANADSGYSQPLEAQDIKCPALVWHDGKFFCFKNAPSAKALPSLDFCRSHLRWFKIHEKLTRDYTYTTCGAEQQIGKDGELFLKCPLDYGNLHRWSDCKRVGCRHIKTVKAEKNG